MGIHHDLFPLPKLLDDLGVNEINRFTVSNGNVILQVIDYGATITSLKVPDNDGILEEIVLGFDDLTSYLNHSYYFGCTIGRYANRISKGKFILDNKEYTLAQNNGINHLHGGIKGFDKVIWKPTVCGNQVTFNYISPALEENYPGEVKCEVTYSLTDKNEVYIQYKATTSQATPINLTNHSYFNLGGHNSESVYDHVISINADFYTPVDKTSIPTGVISEVNDTEFDLRKPILISEIIKKLSNGVDHNFCINGPINTERKVASVWHPKSGRQMEVFSTQPGVQFYTANFLPNDGSLQGKMGKLYKKHGAFCLETQNYPDAVNHFNFPNAVLDVGEEYVHTTRFCFSIK